MAFLVVLIVLSVAGLGAVFWLLKNDQEGGDKETPLPLRKDTLQPPQSGLLAKFAKFKKKSDKPSDDIPQVTPPPKLKELLPIDTTPVKSVSKENPPQTQPLSKEEEKDIEREIDLSASVNELKAKYDKIDALLNEKSAELEKTKQALESELKNRKEFNKVKDVLEKELKDSKDKTRGLQAELKNVQTENESRQKRTAQLEEKSTKLEKELLAKQDAIADLKKQPQKPDAPSQSTTSPAPEEKPKPPAAEGAPKTEIPPPEKPEQKPAEQEQKQEQRQEGGDEKSSQARSGPTGSFKLDLSVDEKKDAQEKSQDQQFLKLQPDIISAKPPNDESKNETKQDQQPSEKNASGNQKPEQDKNNTPSGKEET